MRVFEIPLTPRAQRFDVSLGGSDYFMQLIWNSVMQLWVLDIADTNNVRLVAGIPLVAGSDLLAQYRHLAFGGMLVCLTNGDPTAPPSYSNLGTISHLVFVTVP